MPQPPRQLDSRIEIVTPENIAFHYVLAGPFRRLPAYLIDCLICAVVLIGGLIAVSLLTTLGSPGGLGFGIWLLIAFGVSWFYFGLFETLWNGQTPGKRALGLRVLSIDGQPINAMQAILRNVLRAVDAMPILGPGDVGIPFYMIGLLAAASNDRYQRLGDLTCGTIVVVERRSKLRGVLQLNHPEVIRVALELPRSVTINRGLAQALSTYVSRRDRISPARRMEIANTLAAPLAARFGLPAGINPDLLLCALYYRTFIADTASGIAETVSGVPQGAPAELPRPATVEARVR